MSQSDILQSWEERACVLATMHQKDRIIAPLLEHEVGMRVMVPADFNTDQFGTFTGEVKRVGNQLEAARKKALSAMALTGVDLGLASEGSFGAHPAVPFLSSNLEIVVLIDKRYNLEIVGHYRTSKVLARGQEVTTPEEVVDVANSWGFPQQGVILRQSEKGRRNIYKELRTVADLQRVSAELLSKWFVKSVYVETDMRAHRCPARTESIKQATIDLIKNCKSVCPKCSAPGFVPAGIVKGLPCSVCQFPTDVPMEITYSCQRCHFVESQVSAEAVTADSAHCDRCNP